jgi:hypothetical protein
MRDILSSTSKLVKFPLPKVLANNTAKKTLDLPTPHKTQQEIIDNARRFNVACLGRRSGKTTLGIRLLVVFAEKGYPVAWCSPSYRMLVEVWRALKGILHFLASRISETEKRIDLFSGGVIEMWSLDNADAIRGRKYHRIIIDEAAMVRNLSYIWNSVLRPTLTDLRGDAYFLSTPRGRNFFWECYEKGNSEDKDWYSCRMPSMCNPYLSEDELEEIEKSVPVRTYRQEILAEFLDDGNGVFNNVQKCATGNMVHSSPSCVFGIDWGRHNDYTVISVFDIAKQAFINYVRFTSVSYPQQLEEFQRLYNQYKPVVILAEQNAMGEPLIEQLADMGYPIEGFMTTNTSKNVLVDTLALALEKEEIALLNDQVVINEFIAYEQQRTSDGRFRFSAPEGQHDDIVMSFMLAYFASKSEGDGWDKDPLAMFS